MTFFTFLAGYAVGCPCGIAAYLFAIWAHPYMIEIYGKKPKQPSWWTDLGKKP